MLDDMCKLLEALEDTAERAPYYKRRWRAMRRLAAVRWAIKGFFDDIMG